MAKVPDMEGVAGFQCIDPGDLKLPNFIVPNAGSIFSRSRCPGRRDLLGNIRIYSVRGFVYTVEGTAAVVVGAGLVDDTRALLSVVVVVVVVVVVGGAFEDSLAASMSMSSCFSESSWSRQDSVSSSPGVAISSQTV